jgi:hypothetical protein
MPVMDHAIGSSAAVLNRIGRAFALAATDSKAGPHVLATGLVLRVTAPDGASCTITLGPEEVSTVDGPGECAPDVILEAPAATLARVWTGEVDAGTLIGRREMSANGPINEILRTLVVLPQTYALYRRLLRADTDAQAEGGTLSATA